MATLSLLQFTAPDSLERYLNRKSGGIAFFEELFLDDCRVNQGKP